MDTMYIMGFKEEFNIAVEHAVNFNFDLDLEVSFFETTIRVVGGLLGAFELSKDQRYGLICIYICLFMFVCWDYVYFCLFLFIFVYFCLFF